MKRIIGFLLVICMLLSFFPTSFAAVSGIRYDYIDANSLGFDKNGNAYSGSTVSGETEKSLKYANTNGNVGVYLNEDKTGIEGEIYLEFKMLVTDNSYEKFRLQLVSTSNQAPVELNFTPQRENGTFTGLKLSPQPAQFDSNIYDKDIFSLNEWITICMKVDTDNRIFDLSIKYQDGTETIIYSGQSFNKTATDYNVRNIQFGFNSGGSTYAGPSYFKHFNAYKMLGVTQLVAPEDKEADINKECSLPSSVTAILENNTTRDLAVTWTAPGVTVSAGKCTFTESGEYILTGTVAESDKTVTLKVTVSRLPEITSLVNPANGEAEVNVEYTLPSKVVANYDIGETKEVSVTWTSPGVDISGGKCTFTQKGTYTFTGAVDGTNITPTYIVDVLPISITEYEKVNVYLEKHSDAMPKTVKVGYRNGTYGFEEVAWNSIDRNATQIQTITGSIQNYEGNVEPAIEADVYLYDAGDPLFVEECNYENGEHLGYKYLSPLPRLEEDDYWGWDAETNEDVVARPDPTNPDNMAIFIPVRTSELTLKDYSFIDVGAGREGISVVSLDLFFTNDDTSFVTQLISDSGGKVVEHTYDVAIGKVSNVGDVSLTDAYKSNEWVNFKWIVNLYTDTYDLFINNIKVSSQTRTRTERQKNILSIRFANKSVQPEGTAVYVDNIKMYHLTAMLEDDYEEIKLTDTNVTGNLSFSQPRDTTVTASWSSNDTSLIENNGTVHLPAWKSGNKPAKVTLALSKNIGAGYQAQKKATFDLVVKEAPPTANDAISATLEWLNFDVIKKENTSTDIYTDLTLPDKGLFDTTISWSGVSAKGPVDSEGKIYVPESADTPVTLTATISKEGAISQTKTFNLTVKYQAELSDLQAVRRAKAALAEFGAVNSSNTKLILPSSGANGVNIAWKSLNTDKLSDKGEWQEPALGGTAVMQAIFTKGNARETREFSIYVSAGSSGNGGGGSNGGGGNRGGAMVAPSMTPVVTEPEKVTHAYSDITGYDWAHIAIQSLTNAGVITGTGDNKFEPARNVNREEFVAMAVRGFEINSAVNELPFTDVSKSDWYYETTKKAYGFGLVSGISDLSFGSGMVIKRQDMFVIMYNAAKKLGISLKKVRDAKGFADSGDISEYAREAVTALYEAGIVNGYGDCISPLKSATRAEAAKMIYEIRSLVK